MTRARRVPAGRAAMPFSISVIGIALVLAVVAQARTRAYGSARGLWLDTLARRPANCRAFENASVFALRAGQDAQMLALYSRYPAATGDFRAQARLALALERGGRIEEAAHARARAIALIDETLGVDDGNADAWFHRGNLLRGSDPAGAERAYRNALAGRVSHADACANLGPLVALRDPAEARGFYEQALAIDPRHADAWNNLGVLLMREGDRAEAGRCFRAALAARPTLASARTNLARIEAAAGGPEP